MVMKWLHNILKGASLTTALFIFQACYGTPEWLHDDDVQLQVVSAEDGSPIDDVEIYTRMTVSEDMDWDLCGYTDEEGVLSTTVYFNENYAPQFRVSDPSGRYAVKDTVVADLSDTILIMLEKAE